MFDKFGEFDSAEEINKAAQGLKDEGDTESIKSLAKENGLDPEDAIDFINGEIDTLTTPLLAAGGKLDIEEEALNLPKDILIRDWVNYIRQEMVEDEDLRAAVRKKSKKLSECVGALMKFSFDNRWEVPKAITEGAKLGSNCKVSFGIPSKVKVKEIIKTYYGGEDGNAEKGN